MTPRIETKSLLLGTLLGAAAVASIAAATDNDRRAAWEYRVVTGRAFQDELGKAINASVAEGWEFVSASGPNNENRELAVLRRERR
jgi:hypothetical protein